MIEFLVEKRVTMSDPAGKGHRYWWGLLDDTSETNMAIIGYLCNHGSDPEKVSGYLNSALVKAAGNHNLELIQFLLQCGADINVGYNHFEKISPNNQNRLLDVIYQEYEKAERNVSEIVVVEEIAAYLIAKGAVCLGENEDVYNVAYWFGLMNITTYYTLLKSTVNKFDLEWRGQAVIRSISFDSFLVWDENAYFYHPVKIFDDNLKTGWIDGVKGDGKNSSFRVVLDREIFVDEIRIAPGYFDKRLYSDNNRIKKITIKVNDTEITSTFKDEMEVQSIPLGETRAFHIIEFIIDDIYSSPGSDDTALSEIQFFNKNRKIILHLNQVCEYRMKKTLEQALTFLQNKVNAEITHNKQMKIETMDFLGTTFTQVHFKTLLSTLDIPAELVEWKDIDSDHVVQMNEFITLNPEYMEKIWNIAVLSKGDDGLSLLDYHKYTGNIILSGDTEKSKLLLNQKIDINYKNGDTSFLRYAVASGNVTLVKYLLKNGLDLNETTRDGRTLLFTAIKNKKFNLLEWLIKQGIDVNKKDTSGLSPLLLAAKLTWSEKEISELLEKGETADEIVDRCVMFLIDNGADYAVTRPDKVRLIYLAVKHNLVNTLFFILDKENLFKQDPDLLIQILKQAIARDRVSFVDKLFAAGADVNTIFECIESCDDYVYDSSLIMAFNLASISHLEGYKTPLTFAFAFVNPDMIKTILKYNPDFDTGYVPLSDDETYEYIWEEKWTTMEFFNYVNDCYEKYYEFYNSEGIFGFEPCIEIKRKMVRDGTMEQIRELLIKAGAAD